MTPQPTLIQIKQAVKIVTGLDFTEYAVKCRKRELFFARMLFCHQCFEIKMKTYEIANLLNNSNIQYMKDLYPTEIKLNPNFRINDRKVTNLLNPTNELTKAMIIVERYMNLGRKIYFANS